METPEQCVKFVKALEQAHWGCYGVFFVNFELIPQFAQMFHSWLLCWLGKKLQNSSSKEDDRTAVFSLVHHMYESIDITKKDNWSKLFH